MTKIDSRTGSGGTVRGKLFLLFKNDKKLWRAVTAHVLKGHGIYKKVICITDRSLPQKCIANDFTLEMYSNCFVFPKKYMIKG